jgi:hypothetical protein
MKSNYGGARSAAVDASGNSVVTGVFSGLIFLGNDTLQSRFGNTDMYVAKFDIEGNCIWGRQANSMGNAEGLSVALSNDGNIYVTGYFFQEANFGAHHLQSYGQSDIFFAKYNPEGSCVWAKNVGGVHDNERGTSVAINKDGFCYFTGHFQGDATFGQFQLTSNSIPEPDPHYLPTVDIFLAKYDLSGNCIWVTKAGGSSTEWSYSLTCDDSQNITIAGQFWGTAQFGSITISQSNYSYDGFIANYSPDGNCNWVQKYATSGDDQASNLFCISNREVYFIGHTAADSGNKICKLSNSGEYIFSNPLNFDLNLYPGQGGHLVIVRNGFYLAGDKLTKSDFNGNLLWSSQSITNFPRTTELVIGYDGNKQFIVFGQSTDGLGGQPFIAKISDSTIGVNGPEWNLAVEVTVQNIYDLLNSVSVDSLATEGYDPFLDTPNPPTPPGNYIDAYFYHPEWNSPLGSKFASDVKKSTDLADTVKRWFFEVETNVLNDTIKLQFAQEDVPSKFGKYLTDMQTGKRVDLRYTDTYKYYNTSTSPRKFQLIIGDSTSPVISNLIPKGDEIWRSNTNKTVSWTMSDGTGIDTVFLYSSNNNGANFNRFASIGNISNYNWSIPQEYLNNGYRVKTVVRDSLGNESEIISPLAFTVVGDSLLTQSYAGWNLTGTPLLPNDTTLAGILGDDIVSSPYFVWAYSLSTGYTIPLGLSFGTGYWLGLLNNHTWDVRGTAVESDSTGQSLNLGYNLISTKYVREVSKDRMTFVKSGTSYSFNSAVTAGLISNAIFAYNGNGYTEEDTLSLFGGYWLGVLQEGVTLHQKPVSTQLPISKGNQEPELLTEKNWKLRLNAESGIQSDNITEIGVTETATAGYDTDYDAARPPVPPVDKFIEIYSEVSGPGYPQFLGNRYARDFKNTPNWTIKVKKGITRSNEVTINWNRNELGNLPYGMRITMTDLTTGQTIDMRRDSSYTFTYTEERTFLINGTATGIEDAATAPTDFSLSQNYPNPFNPSTKIRYSLPEESRVKITVYNSLGEMVKIMTNETAQRGWYETTFDATAIPSGIYFAKIETQSLQSSKQFIQTIKMLLIK